MGDDRNAIRSPAEHGREIPPSNQNNFNFLRLFFASSVILTHSVELVDGSQRREPLLYLLNSPWPMSYLAVDGFFLLSGYLITQSWLREPDLTRFLWKRVLRIYPGFVVAILFSALIVGPMGGNPHYWRDFDIVEFLTGLATLRVQTPKTFESLHYPHVNGSAWTIPYEFLCYLMTAFLGYYLLLRRRMAIVAACLCVMGFLVWQRRAGLHVTYFGPDAASQLRHYLWTSPRMVIAFLTGTCFFLFRDRIRYHWLGVLVSLVLLRVACMRQTTALLAFPIIWGYLVFAFAFAKSSFLRRFGQTADVSYGIYLYAWPIQTLIIYHFPQINPYLVSAITFFSSVLLGTLSWYAVERPFLRLRSVSLATLTPPWGSQGASKKVDPERA